MPKFNRNLPSANALAAEKWLMAPHRARTLIRKVADLNAAPPKVYEDGIVAGGVTEDPAYTLVDGVAIIPVIGVLTKYPTWADDWCGFCPSLLVQASITEALNDGSVRSITLKIDSPGGYVAGTNELAEFITKVNGSAAGQKPIDAVVSDLCASGGYMLASQCRAIYANSYAEIGSIGVYSLLADDSKFWADLGVTYTLVSDTELKGLGADGRVTQAQIDEEKRGVAACSALFRKMIANGRGLNPGELATVATGQVWHAAEALSLKLIDSIASVDDAIQQITKTPVVPVTTNVPGNVAGGTPAPRSSKAADSGGNLKMAVDGQGISMDPKKRAYLESIGLRTDATDEQAQAFYDLLAPEKQQEADAAVEAPIDGGDATAKTKKPAQQASVAKATLAELVEACEGDKAFAVDCSMSEMSAGQARAAYGAIKSSKAASDAKDVEIERLKAELGTQGALKLGAASGVSSATVTPVDPEHPTADEAKAMAAQEWETKPEARKGFDKKESYVSYRSAVLTGLLKVSK